MSRIVIQNKDFKDRSVVLDGRTIDVNTDVSIKPSGFKEMLASNRFEGSLTRFEFEVKKYGVIENILDEYITYLTNPEFLHIAKFTPIQARMIEKRSTALSLILYGDPNLGWTIPFLNDLVKHQSDLSYELLTTDGVTAFNTKGIEALKKLLSFKLINEENAGIEINKEPLFTLDAD